MAARKVKDNDPLLLWIRASLDKQGGSLRQLQERLKADDSYPHQREVHKTGMNHRLRKLVDEGIAFHVGWHKSFYVTAKSMLLDRTEQDMKEYEEACRIAAAENGSKNLIKAAENEKKKKRIAIKDYVPVPSLGELAMNLIAVVDANPDIMRPRCFVNTTNTPVI